jgi:cytochrome c oxidase cbb3-type subunit 3
MNNEPNDSKNPNLMDHEVDGIQELDNLLPRWWVWLFYLTIIFAAVYMGYYHVFKAGDLQAAEYLKEAKVGDAIKSASMSKFESAIGTIEPSKDSAALAQGRNTFMTYCAPCHRPDGGGLVGPNLCDDYWIHGSQFADNVKVIWNGIPEKGMVTWKGVLKPNEIMSVASFVYSLRGTQPPNPKPPENLKSNEPEKPSAFE